MVQAKRDDVIERCQFAPQKRRNYHFKQGRWTNLFLYIQLSNLLFDYFCSFACLTFQTLLSYLMGRFFLCFPPFFVMNVSTLQSGVIFLYVDTEWVLVYEYICMDVS